MNARVKIFVAVPCQHLLPAVCAESWFRIAERCGRWAELRFRFISGYSCEQARNTACEEFLRSDAEYLWFVDSDIVLPGDALEMLLAARKDIVSGIYYRKEASGDPVAEICRMEGDTTLFFRSSEIPREIFRIAGCGGGCLLIRRDVIQKCHDSSEGGRIFIYHYNPLISEDLWFCNLAAALGYEIWANGNLILGHAGHKIY